jgi:protein-tyrosine phosphatase
MMVCHANICRSPMAEALMRHKVESRGLQDHFFINSSGTSDVHLGKPPHKETLAILRGVGIQNYQHSAIVVSLGDFYEYDYIIGMDTSNMDILKRVQPHNHKAQLDLLLNYSQLTERRDLEDPCYTGRFKPVYHLINEATENFLNYLCDTYQIKKTGE